MHVIFPITQSHMSLTGCGHPPRCHEWLWCNTETSLFKLFNVTQIYKRDLTCCQSKACKLGSASAPPPNRKHCYSPMRGEHAPINTGGLQTDPTSLPACQCPPRSGPLSSSHPASVCFCLSINALLSTGILWLGSPYTRYKDRSEAFRSWKSISSLLISKRDYPTNILYPLIHFHVWTFFW